MSKNLVIVESPAKAKTIENYLGKDYKVVSSYGHVRDLPKDEMGIDVKRNFNPTYEISPDKKDLITQLKKLADQNETIYLASDDDREGEAISWHLKETLDLNDAKIRRIVFREITKKAIENAIKTPRGINIDLVNAQQARRVLDRLVGYELSPILWKKIKAGLSAGRVQSVAVRLVVEREREIEKFNSESTFKTNGLFQSVKGKSFKAELTKKFKTETEAQVFLNQCISATFTVSQVETKPIKRNPAPPFTTSTLQQEAGRKLGFSVAQTMTLAQRLYESGKISYMRTDSVNLSDDAIQGAQQAISQSFGSQYVQTRRYKTKSESAQEAHEAIRPTDFSLQNAGEERNEKRLYELIWKRAIASQMAEAQIEKTIVTIQPSDIKEHFIAEGEVIKFDGFLKVYIESTDDEDEDDDKAILPPLEVGQSLKYNSLISKETFTRHPPRYTEATLVKALEEMGIGRPSTYAPTISTIQKRDYIVKESREGKERQYKELKIENKTVVSSVHTENTGAEKNKLFPTNTAMVVNDFLIDHFPNVIDYHFTANVEKEFDEIAEGKTDWGNMIERFYQNFHHKVEDTQQVQRSQIGSSRILGQDPVSGKPVIAKLGRYGAFVQIGEAEDEDKPKFASMRKDQFIENISLEDALALFALPREVGIYENESLIANTGKFGPYIKHGSKYYSLLKTQDPHTVTLDEAILLIVNKRKAESEKVIKSYVENAQVQILNGKWGPYLKFEDKNIKIPKDKQPVELSFADCVALAEAAPSEKKSGFARKKKK